MPLKRITQITILIGTLVLLQCLTYNRLGLPSLKNKLLTGTFSNLIRQNQDSLYVRDYYLSDCYLSDDNIYITNHLSELPAMLKSKFRTNRIYFDTSQNWMDTTHYKYNVAYFTYASRKDWTSLFSLFSAQQSELIILNRKMEYNKYATYHWLLFWWLKTEEQNYSGKL